MSWNDRYPFTSPVGSFKPNPWGLYDMHGNVAEMCSDWHGQNYYKDSPPADPTGPATGTIRVKRGGDCIDYATIATTTFRRGVQPQERNHCVGFRVVCEVDK